MGRQGICHSFPKNIQELLEFSRHSRVQFLGFGIETQLDLYGTQPFMSFPEYVPFSYALRIHMSQACCVLALFIAKSYCVIVLDVYFLRDSFCAISFAIGVAEPCFATT
jgi:hypothetical protein